jgi:hypothetical protein
MRIILGFPVKHGPEFSEPRTGDNSPKRQAMRAHAIPSSRTQRKHSNGKPAPHKASRPRSFAIAYIAGAAVLVAIATYLVLKRPVRVAPASGMDREQLASVESKPKFEPTIPATQPAPGPPLKGMVDYRR